MKYLNRLTLDMRRDNARALLALFCNNRYSEHQQIWSLFDGDPDAQRDFLYRREEDNRRTSYLVLSDRVPQSDSGLWTIESREYRPRLTKAQRLRFLVRVNPVVKRRDDQGRQHRHDVVMDAKKQVGWQTLAIDERPNWHELVLNACRTWLTSRGATNGYELVPDRLAAEGYARNKYHKLKQKNPIFFSSIDLSGELVVTDVAHFEKMLLMGLGPEKGFGCGLVLVRVASHVATS